MIINKNTKIFLSIFSAVLIIITIITIVYTNSSKGKNESQVIIENVQSQSIVKPVEVTEEQNDTQIEGVTLEDTYDNNGITYTYKKEKQNNINIEYPEIEGLKDERVQESINNQIKDRIIKILESNNFKKNSDKTAYAKAKVVGNFADTLSVKILVRFNENFSKNYGVCFRVDNGSRIKLNELFTKNAPKKNIITKSAYRTFALDYYTEEGVSNEFYTNIEHEILNFLTDYNNQKVTEFSFTPQYIELYREGKTVKINMQDYPEYIAIYNRFVTRESLYINTENVAKYIPIFTERPNSIVDLYEKVNDSCIIDVIMFDQTSENNFTEKETKIIEQYKKDLIARLGNIRREKNIYYSNYVSISRRKERNDNVLVFTENEKYATVSDDFNNKIYNSILEAQRREIDKDKYTESKINELNKNMIGQSTIERKYNIETGREIKETEEDVQENTEPEETNNNSNEQTQNQNEITVVPQEQEPNSENTTNTVQNETQNNEEDVTTRVTF